MNEAMGKPHIFCISTYEKGQAFLREAARLGAHVTLLTVDGLREADWPREALTELLTMPENLTAEQILNTVCYLARTRAIDRIVALDEFDLEAAALVREHMQLRGLGQTVTRNFRDKLAMRTQAKAGGVAVPEFTGVFNYEAVRAFLHEVPGPWLLKPRTSASAIGIKTVRREQELRPLLERLGDEGSHHVLEAFVEGEVFHVEGIVWNHEVLWCAPCKYGKPPMETMHQGGIFTTRTLDLNSDEGLGLTAIHAQTLKALGLPNGVTHSEFIRGRDGQFYFLETAARVGGAYIAETVEFATGVNPWVEWARIEVALALGKQYRLPVLTSGFAGSVISLARQETPDLSSYDDAEIALRLNKRHHAGLILRSSSGARIRELIENYTPRFLSDFNAVLAVPEKPTS